MAKRNVAGRDAKPYDAKTVNMMMAVNRDEDERTESEIRGLIEKALKGKNRDRALDWLKRKAVWPATTCAQAGQK